MNITLDERERRLPIWAQQIIADQRTKLVTAYERNEKEITALRKRNELLESKTGALEELLTCAASGGHKTAQEIIKVLEGYSLSISQEGLS